MTRGISITRPRSWPHAARVALLLALALVGLGWMVAHTQIVFADGLRYIEQARQLDRGDWAAGLRRAVDHPLYPLAVAATHRVLRLGEGPAAWQLAAQLASAGAGVLLVVPLYLVARTLFGGNAAWLGCLFVFVVPVPGHVLADALSESTFLLFWTWGFWAALQYLRAGAIGWLVAALAFGALSYLSRPEGLLLPLSLGATLLLLPLVPRARLDPGAWWSAMLVLGLGASAVVGPFVAFKGGLATKPAVARLLGLAPPSRPDAVERERPLDPGQSAFSTASQAIRSASAAVRDATTLPLLVLAAIGLAAAALRARNLRPWLFLAVVIGSAFLALARLHATGGYCTPRHALLIAFPLIASAASGLRVVMAIVVRAFRTTHAKRLRPLIIASPAALALGVALANGPSLLQPVNGWCGGYRQAGEWLSTHVGHGERIIDVTGWSQYYSERPGYVFATLVAAPSDPNARWVVVRDAHLYGPWPYCRALRDLTLGAKLVIQFPAARRAGQSRVSIYYRNPPEVAATESGKLRLEERKTE